MMRIYAACGAVSGRKRGESGMNFGGLRRLDLVPLAGRIKSMKPAQIETFFRLLTKDRAIPRTELEYINPYTLLVAVVLSAQATDVSVNKATEPLFKIVDTPKKMVALGEARLKEFIKTIGLFNTKAKNVIALSQTLDEKYAGEVPKTREALEALPGVGRKTANVVMNVAFGEPTIAVDTHIFRVGNRTGLAPGKTPRAVEDKLVKVVPKKYMLHAHHWLILHGRYICVARKPKCPECPVRQVCEYKAKSTVDDFALGKPPKAKPVAKAARLAKKKRAAVRRKQTEDSEKITMRR
jgi:endonuclease-3